jgi:electron transfer flavoprotein beta subunit
MHIVVPIKQVPETNAVKMDERTGTMIREGVEAIVNPLDLYAIEAALELAEATGGRTTAISMGPPKAAAALREAVAMGIDEAVLLSDKAFAGSDTWATSYVLAAAIRRLEAVEVVLCGERATDGDTGQVGPGIAAWLDLPVLTYVGAIESAGEGLIRVRRLVENGYEVLEADLPAVLTVVKEVASPRLPTLRGKQRARRMDLPHWSAAELDVNAGNLGLSGSPTRVVKIHRPQVARTCIKRRPKTEAQLDEAIDELVAFLEDRQLLAGTETQEARP